jgi:hypothetical protein
MDESESTARGTKSLDEVLAHFGVPGMHWGRVKSDEGVSSGPTAVATKLRPGKKVKTSGGKGQPASADAIATAISKQTAHKSSTDALSNKELQAMVTRMNLEQQYSKLKYGNAPTNAVGVGVKFAGSILKDAGKQQATKIVVNKMGDQLAKMMKA